MGEWGTEALTDVLDFREGPGILAKDFHDEGVPLVRLAGVKQGAHILDGCNYLDPLKVAEKWSHFRLTHGDVLLSTSASLGEVAVVGADGVGAVPYTGLIRFRPADDRMAPRFVSLALTSGYFKAQIEAMGVGSVMKHFGPMHLRQMRVEVPPRGVQEAIADVATALDDRIAANTRLAATAEGLLCAEFEALRIDVEPGTGLNTSVPVIDLFEVNPKRGKPADEEPVYVDMARLPTRSFSISDWTRRPARGGVRFTNGDTVMARITPCLENGKVGYIDFLEDAEIGIGSTEYIVLRSRVERGVPLPLSYFLARSPRFQANAVQHMVGTSGRQRLAADDIKPFLLGVPDVDALARFGRVADPLFAHVRSLTRENSVLAATRDTLLPQLMSGKLRVREAAEMAGL